MTYYVSSGTLNLTKPKPNLLRRNRSLCDSCVNVGLLSEYVPATGVA